jgi:predicted nucleic acid-binding protein
VIPPGVLAEIKQDRTPEVVRQWVTKPPSWLEVRSPHEPFDEQLLRLGRGEREAIALAVELGAAVLILDEVKGRREAIRRQLNVVGTVGVLRDASREGLVDLAQAFSKLQQTTFRATPDVYQSALEDARRRSK